VGRAGLASMLDPTETVTETMTVTAGNRIQYAMSFCVLTKRNGRGK
jgi:hypothetical protein